MGEYLAFVVDDAICGRARHRATAKRVHSYQPVSEQSAPGGGLDEEPPECGRRRFELPVVVFEHRTSAHAGPVDAHTVIVQGEPAVAAVVTHHEKRLRMRHRARVRAGDETLGFCRLASAGLREVD